MSIFLIFFKLGVNIHFSHEIRTQMFGNNILYKCSSINQKKNREDGGQQQVAKSLDGF